MLKLVGVGREFRRGNRAVHAVSGVDLEVERGEFVSVLGPSGCGKSTLLHMIGGFDTPTTGSITVNGRPVTSPGRDRGMVFQQATLFPWRTVESNVAWPLEVAGTPRKKARRRAGELLEMVGLQGFERALPSELSGGMRQRAAIARTLGMDPEVLLMDEPFGALDSQTRELMQEELARLWQQAQLTVVFVTHDINEATFLGDRVVVMSARPGRIIADRAIDLPRPRDADVKRSVRVHEYHNELWGLLRDQAVDAETPVPTGRS